MIRNLLKPLSFIPALLLMYMIFSFSSQTGEVSSQLSYKVSYKMVEAADYVFDANLEDWQIGEWANKIHFITRKLAHMTEYFALAVAVSFPLYVYGLHGILLMLVAGVICVGFACGDEYHQAFVAGRSPSVKDVCIDSVGVFFGIILVRIIGWTGRKTIFKPKEKVKKTKVKKIRGKKNGYIDDAAYEDDYRSAPYADRPYELDGYREPPYCGPDGRYRKPPYRSGSGYQDAPYHPNGYRQPPYEPDDRYQDAPYGQGRYQEPSYQPDGRYQDAPYHPNGYRQPPYEPDDRYQDAPYGQDRYQEPSYRPDDRYAPYSQNGYRQPPYEPDDRYREQPYDRDGQRQQPYYGREDDYPNPEDDWFDEEDIDIDSAPDASYDANWQDPARANDWGMDDLPPQQSRTPQRRQPVPEQPPRQEPEPQPRKRKKAKKEKDWFFDM